MRSIRRFGFAAAIFATGAFGYACSGSDAGDLLNPNDGTPSGEDGSANDDATTDVPDGDTPVLDATSPRDADRDDAHAEDAGPDADDGDDDASVDASPGDAGGPVDMTFFVTSRSAGSGGNLGGLAGVDKLCQELADGAKTVPHKWRAYLSTTKQNNGPAKAVHAKNRIGDGPWRNAKGKVIANDVAQLHAPNFELTVDDALDEKGDTVPATDRTIFTGTNPDGMAAPDNCTNWTVGGLTEVQAAAGLVGGGADAKASWNGGAKTSCSTNAIPLTKPGRIYCFATD